MTFSPTPSPFPPEAPTRLQTPAPLRERGFSLRAARDDDLPWLRELYASTRAEEMALLPWPDAMKRAFTDQQFLLQHQHYALHYPDTDFMILEHGPVRIGRYYLQRGAKDYLVVDISLLPEKRQTGIGSLLLSETQKNAHAQNAGMRLHVSRTNARARKLYEKLGFVMTESGDTHDTMQWISVP